MAFPAGLETFTARYKARDIVGDGQAAAAMVFCEIETPLYHVASGTIITRRVKAVRTANGDADFLLPRPGQSGLTVGFGGAPISDFGFRFWAQPTSSRPMTPGSETYVNPHPAANAVVLIGGLLNIGAWPYQTIVINPPPDGGDVIWTPDPDSGDEGLYTVTEV